MRDEIEGGGPLDVPGVQEGGVELVAEAGGEECGRRVRGETRFAGGGGGGGGGSHWVCVEMGM